jgi:lipid-A-disaccharide synthase
MIETIPEFSDYQYIVAGSSAVPAEKYNQILKASNIPVFFDKTYQILSYSESALVTSGTAALESAIMNVPQVVCYKVSPLTYHVGKHLVLVKYISLVNLILDKPVVAELIQSDLTAENLKRELDSITRNTARREEQLDNYRQLMKRLGKTGAAKKTVKRLMEWLNSGKS